MGEESPYPAVAVGDEEALGQGLGIDGLQEAFQRHTLAVHPACPHTSTRLTTHSWQQLAAHTTALAKTTAVPGAVLHTCPEKVIVCGSACLLERNTTQGERRIATGRRAQTAGLSDGAGGGLT